MLRHWVIAALAIASANANVMFFCVTMTCAPTGDEKGSPLMTRKVTRRTMPCNVHSVYARLLSLAKKMRRCHVRDL